MSRRADFLQLVQTFVLRAPTTVQTAREAVAVLAEAQLVPEEALPRELAAAAFNFIDWMTKRVQKPAWLEAYEEGQRNRVCVRVAEGGGLAFWAGVQQLAPKPLPIAPALWSLITSPVLRKVETTANDAELFRTWVEEQPGYEPSDPPFTFDPV